MYKRQVLVAAGSSTRMGFDKLSFDLGGETVLHRSIRAFAQCPQVTEIVLVAVSYTHLDVYKRQEYNSLHSAYTFHSTLQPRSG